MGAAVGTFIKGENNEMAVNASGVTLHFDQHTVTLLQRYWHNNGPACSCLYSGAYIRRKNTVSISGRGQGFCYLCNNIYQFCTCQVVHLLGM